MEIYHALNRGVDKRTIFEDNQDRARFVHSLFEFNSSKPANNTKRSGMVDLRSRPYKSYTDQIDTDRGEAIVDLHGWCLMGNHYHLLLSERVEGGLVTFLRKLNVGYAKYFNERYDRSGTLFQGRTKKIHINEEAHLLHILNYIHLNPLDMQDATFHWRERKIEDSKFAFDILNKYRWSSYKDYCGIKNFPSILTTSFFQDVFEGKYMEQLERYLQDISNQEIRHFTLE